MSDLIDRQAAIDEIKKMYKAAEKWGYEATDEEIKARAESCMASLVEIKLRIEKLPSAQPEVLAHGEGELSAQPEPQWIPCKLKNQYYIPELNGCKDKSYLVTYETATGKRYVAKTNIHNGRVQRKENRIVAWMPLPEPYKGEEL